jgi:hypothetical protein
VCKQVKVCPLYLHTNEFFHVFTDAAQGTGMGFMVIQYFKIVNIEENVYCAGSVEKAGRNNGK